MTGKLSGLTVALALLTLIINAAGAAQAGPPRQAPDGEAYTVQAGDWLTKIAEKYYGDPRDYSPIVEATNAKAVEDASYAPITNPNIILVGQKLWVPRKQGADIITAGDLSFRLVPIEALGLQVAIPAVWPPIERSDPLLRYTWGASQVSFVSFTTTPGNDAQTGLARLLGVAREDLAGALLGGQLSEREFGGHTWTLYTRDNGGLASVAAAMVQDKVIYQVSLFAASSHKDLILETILQNFEITDPTATQQTLTIEAPLSGESLTNPFELRGSTSQYPFRGRLVYRVLDAEGNQVGRAPFEVVGTLGSPSTFAIPGSYRVASDGPGTVEVAEVSAADGTIIAIDSVGVILQADPDGYAITIDDPSPYASIKSPVQVRGKTGDKPFGGTLNYRIVDAGGRQISSGFLQATGQVGQVNLFDGFAEFSVPENGPGRIEVFDVQEDGTILAIGTVNVWLTTP